SGIEGTPHRVQVVDQLSVMQRARTNFLKLHRISASGFNALHLHEPTKPLYALSGTLLVSSVHMGDGRASTGSCPITGRSGMFGRSDMPGLFLSAAPRDEEYPWPTAASKPSPSAGSGSSCPRMGTRMCSSTVRRSWT